MSVKFRLELGEKIYLSGQPCTKAARTAGLSYSELYLHLNRRGLMRPRPTEFNAAKDPSPATILERMEQIKAGWSPEEAAKRWVGNGVGRALKRVFAFRRSA